MNNEISWQKISYSASSLKGRKILFANFPADGHFNPLTGLARHLKQLGCDVRWYTSKVYAEKIEKLNIQHYPFVKGLEIINEDFDQTFPEREKLKGQISKLKFDMINAFILRSPEYYADLKEIHQSFPFEVLVADCAFSGIPFVSDRMKIPVISIGVFPLAETSIDLAPPGLGMTPSYSFIGRIKQAILRAFTRKFIFGEPNKVLWRLLDSYGIRHNNESVFDMLSRKSKLLLQSGTPSFEYRRSDLGKNVRFIGPLLPQGGGTKRDPWHDVRLNQYNKVVLVTQGTVERNVEKILVPTLEAFKDSDTLVVATTGGSGTAELRKRYPESNLIIEDFIPFGDILPYTDVYITNGGYGGVMLSIENEVPMVVAGVHEGKNEINARIGYFGLGINLKTELPKAEQIRLAVKKVCADGLFKKNVIKLSREFREYNPQELTAQAVAEVLSKDSGITVNSRRHEEKIY